MRPGSRLAFLGDNRERAQPRDVCPRRGVRGVLAASASALAWLTAAAA
ncbi:hypothetical protein ABZ568_34480 [Streptomyces olindensis]|uniref:Uncharacterized protein n=1 Tax=Streptomyces olindensis TaxID=358823 RepID=A0ABV2Y5A2_9ACTN